MIDREEASAVALRSMSRGEYAMVAGLPVEVMSEAAFRMPREMQSIYVGEHFAGGVILSPDNELMIRVFGPFQGRGVGSAAYRQFLSFAIQHGISEMTARVRPNSGGHRLLVRVGAQHVGATSNELFFAVVQP